MRIRGRKAEKAVIYSGWNFGKVEGIFPKGAAKKFPVLKPSRAMFNTPEMEFAKTRALAFRKKVSLKQLRLLFYARSKGIFVEKPIRYNPLTSRATFLRQGITLYGLSQLRKHSLHPKVLSRIISETAKIFGALHNIGIVHNDARVPNIVFSKGRIQLIDFDLAELRKKINWENPREVFDVFRKDFILLKNTLGYVGASENQMQNFFELLVENYPKMPEKARKELVERCRKLSKNA
ncbi:MAG: lipopolysaccharide kinase InaA family protein [archaeon]